MNNIIKTYLDIEGGFAESVEQLLINAQNNQITLYDAMRTTIELKDVAYFEAMLLQGEYTFYGKSDGYAFQIKVTQSDLDSLYMSMIPIEKIKYFENSSDELDIHWYATVLINLCTDFNIIRLYAGDENDVGSSGDYFI